MLIHRDIIHKNALPSVTVTLYGDQSNPLNWASQIIIPECCRGKDQSLCFRDASVIQKREAIF